MWWRRQRLNQPVCTERHSSTAHPSSSLPFNCAALEFRQAVLLSTSFIKRMWLTWNGHRWIHWSWKWTSKTSWLEPEGSAAWINNSTTLRYTGSIIVLQAVALCTCLHAVRAFAESVSHLFTVSVQYSSSATHNSYYYCQLNSQHYSTSVAPLVEL